MISDRDLIPFGRLPRFVYLLSKWEGIVEPGSDRQSPNLPSTQNKLSYSYVNVNILTLSTVVCKVHLP
jgi:hypothetical protein